MKKLAYIFFLCVCFSLKAQPPSKWYNKFGGNGVDIGYGVKEGFERKYIAVGSTSSYGIGAVDAYVILIDSMGKPIWQKTFGGALSDVAKSVVVNPVDSGFIFTGYTSSIGFGGYDVYVVRTDKNGNMIWQKSFGGLDWDFGNEIVLAPDGNVIICGSTFSKGYGKKDAYLLKVNSNNGTLIWEKVYGGTNDDEFRTLNIVSSNSILVAAGETQSYNDSKGDIYFMKMDLNGDSILYRSYGLPNKVDFANSIIENPPFNYYVMGGGSESYSNYGKDAFIFAIANTTGDSVWLQRNGNAGLDQEACDVVLDVSNTGTYVISYSDVDFSTFKRDPKHLLLDAVGIYISGNTFGSSEDEELYDLKNTSDKGYIGIGYTKSFGAVDQDMYVIKYDSAAFFGGNLIGLHENQVTIRDQIKIFPSVLDTDHSIVTIECQDQFTFSLLDICGKKIKSGNSNSLSSGSIDLSEQNSGVYFLVVKQDQRSGTFKLVKR